MNEANEPRAFCSVFASFVIFVFCVVFLPTWQKNYIFGVLSLIFGALSLSFGVYLGMAKEFVFKNFDNHKYKILLKKPPKSAQADGLCYPPELHRTAKILVNPDQKPKALQETIIHEIIHGYFWELSEENVTEMARVMNEAIYRFKR